VRGLAPWYVTNNKDYYYEYNIVWKLLYCSNDIIETIILEQGENKIV